MAPRDRGTAGRTVAVLFLATAGLALIRGGLSPAVAQLAAFGALLAASAFFSGVPAGAVLLAAALLGLARAPAKPPPGSAARPVLLGGRLIEWSRDPEGRGGRGVLDRLAAPDGRPLGAPGRRLSFWSPLTDSAPPLGARLAVGGVLTPLGTGLVLERATWRATPGGEREIGLLPRLRQRIRTRLHEVLPASEAGLGQALLLGDRRELPDSHHRAYRELGLLHLLAVSGLHVWLWDALLQLVLVGRLAVLRFPLLFLLALLSGGRPPVVRALAVLVLRDLAAARGRPVRGCHLWAAALSVELALLPPRPADVGLVLSYTATGAMWLARPPNAAPGWRKVLQPSLAAFLGTAPVLHALQGTIEPWSVLLTPVLALLLPVRLSIALLACLPVGSAPIALASRGVAAAEDAALSLLEALPGTPLLLPQLSSLALAGICWMALLALSRLRGKVRARWAAPALLALLWPALRPARPAGLLALDVGHGLAVVVAGTDRSLLFDFGSQDAAPTWLLHRKLLPGLARRGWPPPADLVLSHADSDHANGLPYLRASMKVRPRTVPPGGRRELSGFEPWTVTLWGCRSAAPGDSNAGGQVLEARLGDHRLVLCGDQFGYGLRELAGRLDPGPIDVLLLPHHGLTTDGLPDLLDRLRPAAAWASCGPADQPLPAAPLLARRGIPLHTTLAGPVAWIAP